MNDRIKVAAGQVRAVVVSSWSEALEAVDGREVTLDGVHGTIRIYRPRPYDTRFEHHPSAKGKRSEHYRATRSKLGDDWSSDLTDADEIQIDICEALGVTFRPLTAEQIEAL